jgi:uncharacterized coiled-coil protein SlyX
MNDHEAHLSRIMHEAAVAMERAHDRIKNLERKIEIQNDLIEQMKASLAVTRERLRRMSEGEL